MADLDYGVADGIGTILLNRPQLKNAFTFEMIDHWAEALRSARTDPAVRVIVVTGAGDAFCSGVDLDEFNAHASGPFSVKSALAAPATPPKRWPRSAPGARRCSRDVRSTLNYWRHDVEKRRPAPLTR